MRVLVIGGGAREHALCWALSRSPLCNRLWCAPGNWGIGQIAENVPLKVTELDALVRFARNRRVDLTIVGPEEPLSLGIVDRFRAAGLAVVGPTLAATRSRAASGGRRRSCARRASRPRAVPASWLPTPRSSICRR